MDMNTVEIRLADGVAEAMEERGVNEDDARQVLAYAEGEGVKLVNGDLCLAKKRLGNFTAYVEYKLADGAVEITDVYSHRVMLSEDNND